LRYARGEISGPPTVLLEYFLLKEFGYTPEQLDKTDVLRLLRDMNAGEFYRIAKKPMEKWTPEDIRAIWNTHMKDKQLKDERDG